MISAKLKLNYLTVAIILSTTLIVGCCKCNESPTTDPLIELEFNIRKYQDHRAVYTYEFTIDEIAFYASLGKQVKLRQDCESGFRIQSIVTEQVLVSIREVISCCRTIEEFAC